MKRQKNFQKSSKISKQTKSSISEPSSDYSDSSSNDDDGNSNNEEEQIDKKLFENKRKLINDEKTKDEIILEIKPMNYFPNVRTAYDYLRKLCEQSKLIKQQSLIPVVWRHQLYSFFSSRTKTDAELELMVYENYIRILCHGESSNGENDAIVLMEDFVQHLKKQKNPFINLFISRMIEKHKETEYDDEILKKNGFGIDSIRKLTQMGLLTNTDMDHKQLSFGGLGILVHNLKQGRDSLLRIIRRCKYSQLLQSDLIQRAEKTILLKKNCQLLGLEFHLYDLYGRNGLVERRSANLKGDCLVQLVL